MTTTSTSLTRPGLARCVIGVVLFAVAFAYVESAVVIYLRMLYQPIRAKYYPDKPPSELFPLITADQLRAEGDAHWRGLFIELGREFATLAMLAAVATIGARTRGQWFALFMIAFGIWDIFFYAWLKLCINWPLSLWQWDILFLLPVVWAGPVLSPVLVSLSMIAAGAVILARESRGHRYRPAPWQWGGIFTGALIIILAFCWDFRWFSAGNAPRGFPWRLFAVGEFVGLASFAASCRQAGRFSL